MQHAWDTWKIHNFFRKTSREEIRWEIYVRCQTIVLKFIFEKYGVKVRMAQDRVQKRNVINTIMKSDRFLSTRPMR
jgi:hypothetical protein